MNRTDRAGARGADVAWNRRRNPQEERSRAEAHQAAPKPPPAKPATGPRDRPPADAIRCGACGRSVGLVWFKGRSTLVDGPIRTDADGNLVMARHACVLKPRGESP